MPIIKFLPSGREVEVEKGTKLLEAARKAGIELDSPCGGEGTCGKCAVRLVSGRVDRGRMGLLSAAAAAEGVVLACEARVLSEDLVVEMPERTGWTGGQFSADGDDFALEADELDPMAARIRLKVQPPRGDDGLADLDRITREYARHGGFESVSYSLGALREAADALRAEDGRITVTVVRDGDRPRIIGIEPGDRGPRCLGAAIDIGTTTIAVRLVSLPDGKPLGTEYDYNAQIACGLDVISRINYARGEGRLEELRERVLGTVNGLIERVCAAAGARPSEIAYAVAAGNPTMTHLALGLKSEYLRIAPYTPTVSSLPPTGAREAGIAIDPEGLVYFCPSVGSYVGGDIAAGILCTDLAGPGGSGGVSLFMTSAPTARSSLAAGTSS